MTLLNPNIDLIEAVVRRLGPLTDKVVFLGGAVTGLLLTDPAAPPLRVTRDVDVIVEVLSLVEYYRFNTKLRNCGFIEDTSTSALICRWRSKDSILDVMPTNPKILGFSNRWFKKASASESGVGPQ